MTGFRDRQGFEDLRDKWPDVFDLIGARPQELLRFQSGFPRAVSVSLRLSFQVSPLVRPRHSSPVTRHFAQRKPPSCRNGKFQLRLGILEESDHLITAHRGKILEKLSDRVSAFQTIDQVAHRNPCSHEYRRASENLPIPAHHVGHTVTISPPPATRNPGSKTRLSGGKKFIRVYPREFACGLTASAVSLRSAVAKHSAVAGFSPVSGN